MNNLRDELESLKQRIALLEESRLQRLQRQLRRNRRALLGFLCCMVLLPITLHAFTYPNADFVAGTAAVAADVNARFTAIKNQFDAMEGKSWRLIAETDITVATTQFDIAGLNGDVDLEYHVIGRIVNGNAAGSGYYALRPNGDATGANYAAKSIAGDGGAASSGGVTSTVGTYFGYATTVGSVSAVETFVYAKSNAIRVFATDFVNDISSGLINASAGRAYYIWNSPGTNITFFRIVAPNANGIGAGTHVEVWARR